MIKDFQLQIRKFRNQTTKCIQFAAQNLQAASSWINDQFTQSDY